jgi:hypothetical protein
LTLAEGVGLVKNFIQKNIITYRAILVLIPLPLMLSNTGVSILTGVFLYVLAGLVVRVLINKGVRSSSELGLYHYSCFALHFMEYIWNGFDKGKFVDD